MHKSDKNLKIKSKEKRHFPELKILPLKKIIDMETNKLGLSIKLNNRNVCND